LGESTSGGLLIWVLGSTPPPPPLQGRAPGRPKNVRIRSSAEGRIGLRPRKHKCKRCEGLGHIASGCKNAVDPAFGEDEHLGAENAQEPLD
jgi:hypothetical protein